MITDTDIRRTFDEALLNLLPELGITRKEVAWKNATFRPIVDRPYLRPALLPAETEQAALGYPCYVRLHGIYQISILEQKDTGSAQGETWGDLILAAFPFGRVLDCCGCPLVVSQSYRGPMMEAESRAMTPISVVYYCHTLQAPAPTV